MAGDDMEIRKALSCELAVPDDMPPTFVWHTSKIRVLTVEIL